MTNLKEKTKAEALRKAKQHSIRVKFHAESGNSDSAYASNFLAWVRKLIPWHKFDTFQHLLTYPTKTSELSGVIFDRLSKIWDGRNAVYSYNFTDAEAATDWQNYRDNVLKLNTWWPSKGWKYFAVEPNAVLVVDLPSTPNPSDRNAQPYLYPVPLSAISDFTSVGDTLTSVTFKQSETRIADVDATAYRVYENDNGRTGKLVSESLHGLGYCPACWLIESAITETEPDTKASVLSKVLGALDWFLFFSTSKRHLDLHGAYPIYSGYAQDCNYENTDGSTCVNGYLHSAEGSPLLLNGAKWKCPDCSSKKISGAGSFVEVPVPSGDEKDLRNPIQMLTVDRSSLDYNVSEEARLREEIISTVVGSEANAMNRMAINELQVNANFDNQSTVLTAVKQELERAIAFVDSTICRLRYGKKFINASVNLGTEFYTLTADQLRKKYTEAKANGASETELGAIQTDALETEYRHNPAKLQRLKLLKQLEPYPQLSRAETVQMYRDNFISATDLQIKINFPTFVARFENENGNIVDFARDEELFSKIEKIKNKFEEYANLTPPNRPQ